MAEPVDTGGSAWLRQHIADLQKKIDELTNVRPRGRGAPEKAKANSDAADRLERRVSRMLRSAASSEAQEERLRQRARALAKSKSPRDRAQVVLAALDELPVDLALEVATEGLRRAKRRAGE